jgi:hypothetical protein
MDLPALALAAMLALSPPERHRAPPGWQESTDVARARYARIAQDIAAVAAEQPTEARQREAVALLVGVGAHESGFYADVTAGQCYRGPGWEARCDGGRAVSPWQMQEVDAERRELYRVDTRAAAREALRRISRSLRACARWEPALRLASYASGSLCHVQPTGALARVARSLWEHVRRAAGVRDVLESRP